MLGIFLMASKQFQKMKKAKVIKKDSQKIRLKFQNSITFNEFVFCQKRSKNKRILQHSKKAKWQPGNSIEICYFGTCATEA